MTKETLEEVGIEAYRLYQIVFALELTYDVAHIAIKTSILLLYRSIFTLNGRWFRLAWYTLAIYVFASLVIFIVVSLLQCRPVQYFWEQAPGVEGSCVDLVATYEGVGVMVLVADLALLILPLPMVWKLKIHLAQKLQLSAIFAVGLV